jgi:hypothetical protein
MAPWGSNEPDSSYWHKYTCGSRAGPVPVYRGGLGGRAGWRPIRSLLSVAVASGRVDAGRYDITPLPPRSEFSPGVATDRMPTIPPIENRSWYSRHYDQAASLFGMPPQIEMGRDSLPLFLQIYTRPEYKSDGLIVLGTQGDNQDLIPQQAELAEAWDSVALLTSLFQPGRI